jgi:activator of HSP90 ATPase
MAKTIRQTRTFGASPTRLYDTLMDSRKHAAFTGEAASISKKVGGKIAAYGDYIEGKNVELIRGRKIVQLWRGSDWPEGHFSKVIFKFKSFKGGAKLTFTQTGVPDAQYKSIKQGWIDFYWEPMRAWLGKR